VSPAPSTAQVAAASRAGNKVEVVGHQAVAEDIQRETALDVDDGLDKAVTVPGPVKDGLSTITTVEDIVSHAADGSSGSSCHATILKQAGLNVNFVMTPFPNLYGYVDNSPAANSDPAGTGGGPARRMIQGGPPQEPRLLGCIPSTNFPRRHPSNLALPPRACRSSRIRASWRCALRQGRSPTRMRGPTSTNRKHMVS
jgi:hypothetical protein